MIASDSVKMRLSLVLVLLCVVLLGGVDSAEQNPFGDGPSYNMDYGYTETEVGKSKHKNKKHKGMSERDADVSSSSVAVPDIKALSKSLGQVFTKEMFTNITMFTSIFDFVKSAISRLGRLRYLLIIPAVVVAGYIAFKILTTTKFKGLISSVMGFFQ